MSSEVWPENKDQIPKGLKMYWTFWDDIALIDGAILKNRCEVIPELLNNQALEQLHANHMWIEKTKPMAHESICWTNINDDIEKHIKSALHVLIFS